MPAAAQRAATAAVPADLAARLTVEGGDFFREVPAGADAYLLKHIIHDWSDEHCRTILRHVAGALSKDGRLLVCEMVMPESAEMHPARFMDLNMLAMTEGGCERTRQRHRATASRS